MSFQKQIKSNLKIFQKVIKIEKNWGADINKA